MSVRCCELLERHVIARGVLRKKEAAIHVECPFVVRAARAPPKPVFPGPFPALAPPPGHPRTRRNLVVQARILQCGPPMRGGHHDPFLSISQHLRDPGQVSHCHGSVPTQTVINESSFQVRLISSAMKLSTERT